MNKLIYYIVLKILGLNYIKSYDLVQYSLLARLYLLFFPKSWFGLKIRLSQHLRVYDLSKYLELRLKVDTLGSNSPLGSITLSTGLDSIDSLRDDLTESLIFIAPIYEVLPFRISEDAKVAIMNYSLSNDYLDILNNVEYIFYSGAYNRSIIEENHHLAPHVKHIERRSTVLSLKTPWTLNLGNWALQFLYEEAVFRVDLWGFDLQLTVDRNSQYYVDNSDRIKRWFIQACEHDPVYMFEHMKKLHEVGLIYSTEKTSKRVLEMKKSDFGQALLLSYGPS